MSLNSNGNVKYSGQSTPLFKLAFVTGLLTIITLGIYRFWAKTRLRKYIWSSISVDGDSFEYTGTGLEKLLGFLVAIVFLGVYLTIIQVLLTFVGLGFIQAEGNELAVIGSIYISFFATVPFLLFAAYRSRRYKLARTRLRGIRFGMDSAAWGYALRAIGHILLTCITLGMLLPRQTYYLEKFMTDRSHYGDATFEQGGRWQDLYGAMKHIFIGLGLAIAGGVLMALSGGQGAMIVFGGILLGIGYIWFFVGSVYYNVHSYAYLTNHKSLGGQVTFKATPSAGKIMMIAVLGGIAVGLAAAISFAILGGVGAAAFSGMQYGGQPNFGAVVPLFFAYMLILVALGAISLVMITQPIIEHICDTLTVINSAALSGVHQRVADAGADADGFADALDVGGAL